MAAYTQVITLSSAGVSGTIPLDPTAKATAISVALTATSSGDVVIQASLWQPGSAGAASWVSISSHVVPSSAASGSITEGFFASVLTPIAGLRLSSTTWGAGTATLQALQSITA